MKNINKLSIEYLNECFEPNFDLGILIWKKRPLYHFNDSEHQMNAWNAKYPGKIAGSKNNKVSMIKFSNIGVVTSSSILWKLYYEEEPPISIMHINGNCIDNRICNLRGSQTNKSRTCENKIETDIGNISMNELPTQQYLQECFDYNLEEGKIYWKERPTSHFIGNSNFNKLHAGKEAGYLNPKGYRNVTIDGNYYITHRIIWKMHYGIEPTKLIDHINGIRDDNRIENLREVNYAKNSANRTKIAKNNTSTKTGVRLTKTGRYLAILRKDKENYRLGYFNTLEEAELARELKYKELYGEEFYTACGKDKLLEELTTKVEQILENRNNNVINVRNNSNGYPGVLHRKGKYVAVIGEGYKRLWLGTYDSIEEAALVYQLKYLELYGEEQYLKICGSKELIEELKNKVEDLIVNREKAVVGRRNSSGYMGVIYDKKRNKYRSRIKYEDKIIELGCSFKTSEEAALAYQLKYIELYGEDKYLRLVGSRTLLEELKTKVEEIKNNRI